MQSGSKKFGMCFAKIGVFFFKQKGMVCAYYVHYMFFFFKQDLIFRFCEKIKKKKGEK